MFLENTGFQRMMGRVLAALWVAEHEIVSADHLASMLKASRGSISTSTRTLEQIGMIERVSIAGERKDYFRSLGNSWTKMLELETQRTTALRMLIEKGLELIESDKPEYNHSLEKMHEFLSYMEEELPLVLERWQKRQAEKEV